MKDMRHLPARLRHVTALAMVVVLLLSATTGCFSRTGNGRGSITLAGSTSVQPFAEMLAEEYAKRYPDRPAVNVQGGGSSAGVRAASTGTAQIGMLSRDLTPSERDLDAITIALDAIAIVVHPSNPVYGLTRTQIAGIFAGTITDWTELGGRAGKIHMVSREEGSGTRGAFDGLIMEGAEVAPRAIVQDSNGAVREIVAGDRLSIGYISLGLVDERVKALVVDGVPATVENCRTGEYRLTRPFLFAYTGEMSKDTEDFLDFVLCIEGQEMLQGEGLVPAPEKSSD